MYFVGEVTFKSAYSGVPVIGEKNTRLCTFGID